MLTILANIRINDSSKLNHLVDSVISFKTVSDNWLVNVRGSKREEANQILQKILKGKMITFKFLEDENGWINNALKMLKKAKHEYILIWNEDHMNIAPQKIYSGILRDLIEYDLDYLPISWWHFGKFRQGFKNTGINQLKSIDFINLDSKKWRQIKKGGHKYYLISSVGIFKKSFLLKMMGKDRIKYPLKISLLTFKISQILNNFGLNHNQQHFFQTVNSFTKFRLKRYPDETPFELEKDQSRTDMLPMKLALPKQELFACIDDDHGEQGYSLTNRGMYPLDPKSNKTKALNIQKTISVIMLEIDRVLSHVNESQVKQLIELLLRANKIVAVGAGRVGMTVRAFEMRLRHLGLDAHTYGYSNIPYITKGDLMLVASGSGETQTTYEVASIAKGHDVTIVSITSNPDSRIGRLSDLVVLLPAPSKLKKIPGLDTIQPMTTLNEQCLWLFFDAVTLALMKVTGQNNSDLLSRHTNIE